MRLLTFVFDPDEACRNGGVKFRYCAYCEAPVAKRNFSRRHAHVGETLKRKRKKLSNGDSKPNGGVAPDEKEPISKKARLKDSGIPESIGNRRSDESPSSETDSTSGSNTGSDPDKLEEMLAAGPPSSFEPTRREAWINLLNQRPDTKDKRAMSVWVRKVLVVSDSQQPLSKLEEISVSSEEDDEKKNGKDKDSGSSSDGSGTRSS